MRNITLRWDGDDMEVLPRVKNMGEDLWHELSNQGLGEASISEIDAARNCFSVRASKPMLNPVLELIRRQLKKHNLTDVVRVER